MSIVSNIRCRFSYLWIVLGMALPIAYQNCSAPVAFDDRPAALGSLGVCENVSCDLTPLTFKPAVTTILAALGDEADDQLVINGVSAQLIAETVVRYTSPVSSPKILVVHDSGSGSEHPADIRYVVDILLSRYDVTMINEPRTGLTDANLASYDIVWFNNPGTRMSLKASRDALIRFKGGVVLQGDDLTIGNDFSMEELTGLKHIDNGTSVKCSDGKTYAHDNNDGESYRVKLDMTKIPGANSVPISFRYGNDIDNSVPARADLEVLASAQGGPEACKENRPVVVRYFKD